MSQLKLVCALGQRFFIRLFVLLLKKYISSKLVLFSSHLGLKLN